MTWEGSEIAPLSISNRRRGRLIFGTPTINGDAVKPVWDLLSSLVVINLKSKLEAYSARMAGLGKRKNG